MLLSVQSYVLVGSSLRSNCSVRGVRLCCHRPMPKLPSTLQDFDFFLLFLLLCCFLVYGCQTLKISITSMCSKLRFFVVVSNNIIALPENEPMNENIGEMAILRTLRKELFQVFFFSAFTGLPFGPRGWLDSIRASLKSSDSEETATNQVNYKQGYLGKNTNQYFAKDFGLS